MTASNAKQVEWSFIALTVVAFFVLLVVGCEEKHTRELTGLNHAQIRQLAADQRSFERFRAERTKLVNRTNILICRKVNASNEILGDLLRRLLEVSPRRGPRTKQQLRAVAIVEHALRQLKPRNCTALPTSKGAKNR